MIIPTSFKNLISETFYDKTIYTYTETNVVDDEGYSRDSVVSSSSFLGNPRFDKLAEIQESYGIREEIDIVISCATTVNQDIGDIVGYDSKLYRLINVLTFDSHKLLFGRSWSSKSSISPSV